MEERECAARWTTDRSLLPEPGCNVADFALETDRAPISLCRLRRVYEEKYLSLRGGGVPDVRVPRQLFVRYLQRPCLQVCVGSFAFVWVCLRLFAFVWCVGLGFRCVDLGFRIWGLGSGFEAQGLRSRACGVGLRVDRTPAEAAPPREAGEYGHMGSTVWLGF